GTAVTRSIIIGDTGSDGSELQITNGTTGGVIMGRFNSTGFVTPLSVQATGTVTGQSGVRIGTAGSNSPYLFGFSSNLVSTIDNAGRGVS
ncbi:hypothetical protein, partial [Caballeronia sp. ATUFL_M1_KS5A]|uniref:hypothetical protein n=1 Tax=Caballeronia sp. ATUFL_M1_KS5A TaxID=2921778 RepID=UPI002027C449